MYWIILRNGFVTQCGITHYELHSQVGVLYMDMIILTLLEDPHNISYDHWSVSMQNKGMAYEMSWPSGYAAWQVDCHAPVRIRKPTWNSNPHVMHISCTDTTIGNLIPGPVWRKDGSVIQGETTEMLSFSPLRYLMLDGTPAISQWIMLSTVMMRILLLWVRFQNYCIVYILYSLSLLYPLVPRPTSVIITSDPVRPIQPIGSNVTLTYKCGSSWSNETRWSHQGRTTLQLGVQTYNTASCQESLI